MSDGFFRDADGLDRNLWEAFIDEKGFQKPTEVQQESLKPILGGQSAAILAKTGSGKTLAYALPLVQKLKEVESADKGKATPGAPRLIVLLPTRELAFQGLKVFKELAHHAKFRPRQLRGGGRGRALQSEMMDVLFANPGTLLQAVKEGDVSFEKLKFLVLDEADQLMDMGFNKEIQELVKDHFPSSLQTLLVTATRPENFQQLSAKLFEGQNFQTVDLLGGGTIQRHIETFNVSLEQREKTAMLLEFLIKRAHGRGIVFVNKKETVDELKDFLQQKKNQDELKKPVNFIHGKMSQKERQKNFNSFQQKGGVLVASDVLARGIDLPDLKWVLNYDLPFEAVYYLHRCGRTGRAGSDEGEVINFVTPRDRALMQKINKAILDQDVLPLEPIKDEGKKGGQSQKAKKGHSAPKKKPSSPKTKGKGQKNSKSLKKGPRYKRK